MPQLRTLAALLLLTINRRSVSFLLILRGKASVADQPKDLVQGALDMFILKTLVREPCMDMGSPSGSNR